MFHGLLLVIHQLIMLELFSFHVKRILYELEQLSFGIDIHDNIIHSQVDKFTFQ